MGCLMAALALAFMLLALDATPGASPATSPAPIARCLVNICLGDDMDRTLIRLGDGPGPRPVPPLFSSYDSFKDLSLEERFSGGVVVLVAVSTSNSGPSTYADPYGVKLGDTADSVQRERGAPDYRSTVVWRYGDVGGPHWLYAMKNGVVDSITVTSLAVVPN
jgi:hypothetical protein